MSKSIKQNIISVIALYLIALWPFLNFISHNWQVLTDKVMLYGHVLFSVCLIFSVILALSVRRISFGRWCFVFSVFVPLLFLYKPIFEMFDALFQAYTGYAYEGSMRYKVNPVANIAYSLLACVGLCLAVWCSKIKDRHVVAMMMAAALVALPVMNIAGKWMQGAEYTLAEKTLPFVVDKRFQDKPNVYLIALDGYPRSDVLKDVFEYDNQVMLSALKQSGFQVQRKARTNYPNTHLSLASTMMANYLEADGNPLFSAKWSARITGKNPVVQAFQRQGYRYVHMESGVYALTKCLGYEDICVSSAQKAISEHEYALLKSTPWAYLKKVLPFDRYMTDTGANIGKLQAFLEKNKPEEPFFLFAHTVPPHAPYAYAPDCKVKERFNHGYDEALFGQDEEFFKGYLDNVQCADKYVSDFATYIEQHDPKAIVIFFSDHGSHFTMDWYKKPWTEEQITERYSVLNAVRAPEKCQKMLYDDMTNVNLMRFVFGCLTDTPPVYLADQQFFSSYVPDTPHYGEIVPIAKLHEQKD